MTKETEVLVLRSCKLAIENTFFFFLKNLGHNVVAVIMRKESSVKNLNSITLGADVQVRDYIRII